MELLGLPTVRENDPPTVYFYPYPDPNALAAYHPFHHHITVYGESKGTFPPDKVLIPLLVHEFVHGLQRQTMALMQKPFGLDHPYEVQAYSVMLLVAHFGYHPPEWLDDAITHMVMAPDSPGLPEIMSVLVCLLELELPACFPTLPDPESVLQSGLIPEDTLQVLQHGLLTEG